MKRALSIVSCVALVGVAGLVLLREDGLLGDDSLSIVSAAHAKGRSPNRQRVIDRFLELWTSPFERTVFENRWLGVKTLQNPNDMWITQEILFEVKPDFLVETGTYHGGSAAIWAMILEQINPESRVITIDIEDMTSEVRKLPIFERRVDFILGSSVDPEIVADVERRTKGKKVVVLLDSAHDRDHVVKELHAYAPLVSEGSYLIVQDTIVNGHPVWPDHGPGPYEAVQAFLASNDQFRPDHTRERLLVTVCRGGFLKRIKSPPRP